MEAACNRSVLLQAPEMAVCFTPSSPRRFRKAGANGRSGWSPGTETGSGISQLRHAGTSGILRSPSPGPPAASLRCRDGHEGAGRREGLGTEGGSVARCRGFLPGAAGSSNGGAGSPFLAGALSPGGATCSAGMNLSPAHGGCRHLRRLVRREHPPTSLSASLSRDLLDPPLPAFPTGGERAAAPPPNTILIPY